MGNRSLGMDETITRRDFLNASLIGVGGSLMRAPAPIHSMDGVDRRQDESWYGYGGVGDYANSHGNTPEVVRVAHGIRDGQYNPLPTATVDTGEVIDLDVVRAGMAGLGAATSSLATDSNSSTRRGQTVFRFRNWGASKMISLPATLAITRSWACRAFSHIDVGTPVVPP